MAKRVLEESKSLIGRSPMRVGLSRSYKVKSPAGNLLNRSATSVGENVDPNALPPTPELMDKSLLEPMVDEVLPEQILQSHPSQDETPKSSRKRRYSLSLTLSSEKRPRYIPFEEDSTDSIFANLSPDKPEVVEKSSMPEVIDLTQDDASEILAPDSNDQPPFSKPVLVPLQTSVVEESDSEEDNVTTALQKISKIPTKSPTDQHEMDELLKAVQEERDQLATLKRHYEDITQIKKLISDWKAAGRRALTELSDLHKDNSMHFDVIKTLLDNHNLKYSLFGYDPNTQEFQD